MRKRLTLTLPMGDFGTIASLGYGGGLGMAFSTSDDGVDDESSSDANQAGLHPGYRF